MSETRTWFDNGTVRTAVVLPFDLDAVLDGWSALQRAMIRARPDEFTRQEWAHLIAVLDRRNLERAFTSAFGARIVAEGKPQRLARPRGPVSVWLPNNVSLLGPLTVILLTLTGNPIRVKAGSLATDLTTAFVRHVKSSDVSRALESVLASVQVEQFDREDPRNREMAREAKVRIVFGSDMAVAAIEQLPHPIDSAWFGFSDRASEAWIEPGAVTDELIGHLIQVFAIYGRAGCTSPRRVVIVDGSEDDCRALMERMCAQWPRTRVNDVAMHHASENIMAGQWARALGWDTAIAPRNAAVLATGGGESQPEALFYLPIVQASLADALAQLPANIQTLGYACNDTTFASWLPSLAATAVKRIVPIPSMHHFGPLWDGWPFWRAAFEEVEVA